MNVELRCGPISDYTMRADIGLYGGPISGYPAETAGYHCEERLDNW